MYYYILYTLTSQNIFISTKRRQVSLVYSDRSRMERKILFNKTL
jgi:hypothetical protein